LCLRANDKRTLFPVLYGLWNVCLLRCELQRCKDLAAQLFDLAQDQPDPVFLLQAHNVLQQPLFHLGDLAAARRHQEQGLALYDRREHCTLTALYGEDPGVGCLAYSAVTLWHLGYPEQALASVQASRRLAEELSPFDLARALYFGAFTHLCRRDAARVREWADALSELCREHGFAMLVAGGMILRGWSIAEQGRAEEGVRQMREGLSGWRATGALSHRPYHLALLAEALGRQGQVADGRTTLAEAQALSSATGEHFYGSELLRLRGELLLTPAAAPDSSGQAEAEDCFRQALAQARRQGARPLELRAAMSLSRLFQRQGRPADAGPPLAAAYAWFTEGFDTRDLQEAKALLDGAPG
jgi:predicted ATPase